MASRPAEPATQSMKPANLADDPTFWLVAMFAAASFLALASQ